MAAPGTVGRKGLCSARHRPQMASAPAYTTAHRLALLFWRENHGGLFLPIIIIAIMLRPRDGSYQEWNGIHATFLYHCERQGLEILSHLFPIVCVCESFHCWVRRELPESNCYFHGSYKWKTQLVNNSPINAWLIADCWSANRFWLLGMESRDS